MNQERIKYCDVMALGFKEEKQTDGVYFNEYGFDWCIITKDLTKKIYLDWAKETQLCKLVRLDNPKECNIIKEMPIKDLQHLKDIIEFFSDEKEVSYDSMTGAC